MGQAHWDTIYGAREPQQLTWYQRHPGASLALLAHAGLPLQAPVIDVGGGASTLVDHLVARGHRDVTVLDISERAMGTARERLGERAREVSWIQGDITQVTLDRTYDLWHDRAVFHFLVESADRARYVALLRRTVPVGGAVIVSTFAIDGPTRCSGLEVVRYTPTTLIQALGPGLELVEHLTEDHVAPSGAVQRFLFCRFCRTAGHPPR